MSLWFDGNTIAVFQPCTEGLIGTTDIVQWSRGQTKSGFPHVLLSSSTWNEVYLWALWMYLEEWRSEIDSFEKYQIWSKMESDNRTFPNIFFLQISMKAIAAPFLAVTMTTRSGKPDHTKAPPVFTSTKAIWCHCFLKSSIKPDVS